MSDGCKMRVRDHTDLEDCGEKVFRAGYCEKHWYQVISEKVDRLRELEQCRAEAAKDLAKFAETK